MTGPAIRRLPPVDNPWSLKPRQCQVMDSTCLHGTAKATAQALGLSQKTIECYWYDIRRKMGTPHILLAAVAWDRFRADSNRRAA